MVDLALISASHVRWEPCLLKRLCGRIPVLEDLGV